MSTSKLRTIPEKVQRSIHAMQDNFRTVVRRGQMIEAVPDPLSPLSMWFLRSIVWLTGGILLFFTLHHLFPFEPIQELKVTLLGYIIVLIVGGIALLALNYNTGKNQELTVQGILAQATIIDRWSQEDEGTTEYFLGYTFPGGEPTRQQVKRGIYDKTQVGDVVTVRYVPTKLTCSRLEFQVIV